LRDRKDGAAAVEFALIVPIMLSLYFGTMEISQGVEVNKKAGRASSLIADLVTQQAVISRAEVIAVAGLAEATLQPYNRDTPVVEVVGIQISDEAVPKARVAWSQRVVNGAGNAFLPVGSNISIPSELMIRNTFIVRGGLSVNFYPVTTYTVELTAPGGKGIEMGETYYLRPRTSPTVTCPDC
jgi:Flp pilus assembly protein TadG